MGRNSRTCLLVLGSVLQPVIVSRKGDGKNQCSSMATRVKFLCVLLVVIVNLLQPCLTFQISNKLFQKNEAVFNYVTGGLGSTKTSSLFASTSLPEVNVQSNKKGGGGLPPWLPSFGTAALGGLLFGSDIGASSSVVRILGQGSSDLGNLNTFELGQIASASLLGAMAASAALIFLGDSKIGRKLELQAASVLFTVGTLVQALSPNFALVILGRCIYGLGIGSAMHVAPLYIAETAPDDLRGKLVSLKEAAIVGGIVLGYGAGSLFGGNDISGWRGVYESVLPLEALMLFGAFFAAPESPRWLALRDKPNEAIDAMQKCQGLTSIQAENAVKEMTRAASVGNTPGQAMENTMQERLKEISSSPYNRQALLIGVGLVLFQQLSGQPSVLYFANRIFEKAGLGYEAALGVGIFKLVMTIVSAALVEDPRFGRRSLLLYGNAGITASLAALSALYALGGDAGPNQAAIIACILVFVGCYQIGFGPITWLVLSEIFPLRVRSAAVSIGTLANFGSNLLVALLFETERESLGESALFGQFALIAAAATAFTYVNVFETRGLSLEGIEEKLKEQVDMGRDKK